MKKNVLFIIWSFTYGGGSERVLANIVNHLSAEKYNIEILEYCHSDIGKETVNDNIIIHKPLIDITKTDILAKIKKRIIDQFMIKLCPGLLRKIVLKKTYDVEVSFNYLIPTFLLNKKSSRLISWIHGSIDDLKELPSLKRRQRKSLKKVYQIVAISKNTEKSIIDLFPMYKNKTSIIYNGYDYEKMSNMAIETEKVDSFDLLYCGRMDQNKNPLLFVDVVYRLIKKGKKVRACMLGTGIIENEVKKKIKEYGVEKNIILKGYVRNPYPYLKKCKILCLTSFTEGFPTVIVEAMFFGKPFITTPVAGSKELSKDNLCGFIACSVDEFVEKGLLLLDNDDIYNKMSTNCQREVMEYSLERQIAKIEKLLDE